MLTAISNGKLISSFAVTKKMIQGETKMEFLSRYDKSKMIFVSESHNGRSAHFRHTVKPEFLEKKYGKAGESKKHLLAKADLMKALYQRRPKEIIVIDEDFKTFKGERIPDISVFDSTTNKIIEVKKEDVDVIMAELEVTEDEATSALTAAQDNENNGDASIKGQQLIAAALRRLVTQSI